MAVAFDAFTEFERTGTSDPTDFTHTPVGTPKGVVVAIVHGTDTTDYTTSVSYGGVALTRIVRALDTVTEPGVAELWFCGSGLPTGAQTVSVNWTSATTEDIHIVAATVTASADTEVVDSDMVQENVADPSVTLSYGGRTCIAFAAHYGGGANPTAFTPNANCTTMADVDLGNFYSEVIRQTTPGTADFTIGGTVVAEDVAFAALAVSEVAAAGVTVTPGFGDVVITGFAPSLGLPQTVLPGLGQLTITGFAPTVSAGPTVQPGVGSLVITGFAPSLGLPRTVLPGLGQLTITGFAPSVTTPRTVLPGLGQLTITGFAPSISLPITVRPGVGALTITGFAPTVSSGPTVQPGSGSLVITGFAPTVEAIADVVEEARVVGARHKGRRRILAEALREKIEGKAARPLPEEIPAELEEEFAAAEEARAEEIAQADAAVDLALDLGPARVVSVHVLPLDMGRFAVAMSRLRPPPKIDTLALRRAEEADEEALLQYLLERL